MTSQIRYSSKTSLALLQVYLAMMDGEIMTYDYFNELTGLKTSIYQEVMHLLSDMIKDLKLTCDLERIETDVETSKTRYTIYSYQLLFNNDHKFIMNKELSDEKKIKYSAVILYLTLFKEHYINFNNMTKYFPNFTTKIFNTLMDRIEELLDIDIVKNDINSYEMIDND